MNGRTRMWRFRHAATRYVDPVLRPVADGSKIPPARHDHRIVQPVVPVFVPGGGPRHRFRDGQGGGRTRRRDGPDHARADEAGQRAHRLPDRRVVVRIDFTGYRPHERYWLLLEHGDAEICKTYPGLDEDLYVTADAEAFVKWHAGQISWAEATRDSRIQLDGPSWLVRAFPTWNARSMFAHIKPAAETSTAN